MRQTLACSWEPPLPLASSGSSAGSPGWAGSRSLLRGSPPGAAAPVARYQRLAGVAPLAGRAGGPAGVRPARLAGLANVLTLPNTAAGFLASGAISGGNTLEQVV